VPEVRLGVGQGQRLAVHLAYSYFARMIREECDDYTAMAAGVLEAMRKWLAKHQNALTR
jgi:hypothetical protein